MLLSTYLYTPYKMSIALTQSVSRLGGWSWANNFSGVANFFSKGALDLVTWRSSLLKKRMINSCLPFLSKTPEQKVCCQKLSETAPILRGHFGGAAGISASACRHYEHGFVHRYTTRDRWDMLEVKERSAGNFGCSKCLQIRNNDILQRNMSSNRKNPS